MTVTTTRPTLSIAAAAVMTASITVFALLGVHIQILCLQFIYVILNHLKVSRRFELAGKILDIICELQNGFGRNLDDSSNNYTTKVLMSVSQSWILTITSNTWPISLARNILWNKSYYLFLIAISNILSCYIWSIHFVKHKYTKGNS